VIFQLAEEVMSVIENFHRKDDQPRTRIFECFQACGVSDQRTVDDVDALFFRQGMFLASL
jgi:hypothetical protein